MSLGSAIAPGKSLTYAFTTTKAKFTSAGTYNVKAIADYSGVIDESDESNNELIQPLTVH